MRFFFLFLFLISFFTLSCNSENEKDLNNFVLKEQKFSIASYEIDSIFNLFKERYGFSEIEEEHRLIKRLLLDEIYNNELDFIFDIIFPLPEFTIGYSPKLLVLSPRDKIYREDELLLNYDLSLEEIEKIEESISNDIGYSAVIVNIGGVAAYPSIIKETDNYGDLFRLHAHEWLHQYLILFPLGRAYFNDPRMKIVNETLANIYSERLLENICMKNIEFKNELCSSSSESNLDGEFNYDLYISNLRLQVDELLKSGKINESEELMESSRNQLAQKGYPIRKINQAWFAFNGTYADSPTSSSNVDEELNKFIDSRNSIGQAIKELRDINNYQEYLDLVLLNN